MNALLPSSAPGLAAALCLFSAALAAPLRAVDLKIDVNQRSAANNVPANTESGFTPFVITSAATGAIAAATVNSLTIGAQTITISGTGTATYDDRKRTGPVNSGTFTQPAMLQDFIFAIYSAANPTAGLDVQISGLVAGKQYLITLWSFDTDSNGTRVSDWSANGVSKAENYTFDGRVEPTTNEGRQINFTAAADGTGNILIQGRRDSTSVDAAATPAPSHGVYLNGLRVREFDEDNDLMADEWEVAHGLIVGTDDSGLDPDNDFLTNYQEYLAQTDPQDEDTDNDTLRDSAENNSRTWVSATNPGTSPLLADTDGDGLNDAVENPDLPWLSPAQPGTNPNVFDSDGDSFSDGEEVNWPINPRDVLQYPNPAEGATLAVDLENTAAIPQGGFSTFLGTTDAAATTTLTSDFGAYNVTIAAVGSTTLQSRDRGTTSAIGGFTPMFRDFIFSAASGDNGDGMDITITGLAPMTWYPVTLWSWDPTSAGTARNSTWLASDGNDPPALKVPLYSLVNAAALPAGGRDRRMKFDARSDSSGRLVIQGRKQDGYTGSTINVFLNGFVIGPVVTPLELVAMGPVTPGSFPLTWVSDDFGVYSVQMSADLTLWQTINGAVDGLPGTTTFIDTTTPPGTARRFYRVERVSP